MQISCRNFLVTASPSIFPQPKQDAPKFSSRQVTVENELQHYQVHDFLNSKMNYIAISLFPIKKYIFRKHRQL